MAPVGVFVAAVGDAVAGHVDAGSLAAHLLVAAGLVLLVAVTRLAGSLPDVPPAGGSRSDRPVAAGTPDLTVVAGPVPPAAGRPSLRAGSAA